MFDAIINIDFASLALAAGYAGLVALILIESGVFFGFFLPGDSVLFTAGLLAASGFFNIWVLLGFLFAAAVIGSNIGYWFGAKVGKKLFVRENSFFFHKKHAERTKVFYEQYGAWALIMARFMPVLRTFAPILAGVGDMPYKRFLRYNIAGAFLWSVGVTSLGYLIGHTVPHASDFLFPIVIGFAVISMLPLFFLRAKIS